MAITVTLARPLPLPQITAQGQPVTFLPVAATQDIPAGTRVHCTTSLDPLDARAINGMPDSMALIANIGVGVDNIDLIAAKRRGILVSNTPVVTEDTADLAFALILAASRRLGQSERFLRAGSWTAAGVAPPLGGRVHGKTLGLVGFGAIAQAVARRARGFDMPLRYWNRTRRPEAEAVLEADYEPDLKGLLANSDIISVHTALTPETRNLIDAEILSSARAGAVLINTARGGIVDEGALCDALEQGRIGAAGLDVFEGEPAINHRLLARDDVVLTPHIGSATGECRSDMARRLLANIVSFLEAGSVPDPVTAP
jgi:glyoxylate reductase